MKPNIWTIPQLGVKDRCWNILNSKLKYSKYSKFHILISVCAQSCPILYHPMDYRACQAPLSMGLSRQAYWSGLLFPSPRESSQLRDGTHISCLLHWHADSLPLHHLESPIFFLRESIIIFRNFKVRKKVFCIFLCIYHFQSSALTRGEGNGTPTPVLLPGKSHGRRRLGGCSPWGR